MPIVHPVSPAVQGEGPDEGLDRAAEDIPLGAALTLALVEHQRDAERIVQLVPGLKAATFDEILTANEADLTSAADACDVLAILPGEAGPARLHNARDALE